MAFIYKYRIAIIMAVVKFILPYLLQDSVYELHRDEYLYLAEGNHPAWGFMEVPPLLSIFSRATILLGNSLFWVKCWPALFGSLTVFTVCLVVTELGGRSFAQWLTGLAIIAGVYLRISFLFQPNFLEIFWWTLMAYFLLRFINTKDERWWLMIGTAAGFALLSKYSVLFFLAGILVGLLLTPLRKVFTSKYLYYGIALCLLIAAPNILWQYNHRWPVLFHMRELRASQLAFISPGSFIKDQFLMHLTATIIWIGGLCWLLFSAVSKPYRILAWIYLTVIALLIASSGKNYYAMAAYPMLYAAGSVWLEAITTNKFTWLRYVAVAFSILLFIPIIPVGLPVWKPQKLASYYHRTGFEKAGVLKWEDGKNHPLPQDFADMLGWKELADKVSAAYAALPEAEKKATMIHCRNYGQAGAITFYGKGLPQVNTDNASFLFWMPDKYAVNNILLVARRFPADDDIVFQHFENYRLVDSVSNPLAREYGTKIYFFQNGRKDLNALIEKSVKEQKDAFRR